MVLNLHFQMFEAMSEATSAALQIFAGRYSFGYGICHPSFVAPF